MELAQECVQLIAFGNCFVELSGSNIRQLDKLYHFIEFENFKRIKCILIYHSCQLVLTAKHIFTMFLNQRFSTASTYSCRKFGDSAFICLIQM